ncbi:hypothetical protein ACFLW6_04715 [Chloroflexota bacterium]
MERQDMKWKSPSLGKRLNQGKVALVLISLALACFLTGCGVSAEQYGQMAAQLRDAQAQNVELQAELQNEHDQLEAKNKSLGTELKAAQTQIGQLQSQISGLREQCELVGKTPTDTA